MKVAFTGTSGSGKTTLVKWVAQEFGLRHISGSAGDLARPGDNLLKEMFGFPGGGHSGVIKFSALNPEFGILNQQTLQRRRADVITNNTDFVTDRSPIDNLTYFVNQVGFHPMVTDEIVADFIGQCINAWSKLTHVIYIRPVQPYGVEQNFSRVDNQYYQYAIDAQFNEWYKRIFKDVSGPMFHMIDYWDLKMRKETIYNFLKQTHGKY